MSPSNHDMGFRPSHFGALEACIHHEQKPAGAAAENGIEFHGSVCALLEDFQLTGTWVVKRDTPQLRWAAYLVDEYQKQGWSVLYVEKEVSLAAPDGDTMTTGTIDLVMVKNHDFLIIDWKTGEGQRDYSAQMAGYIMAIEELHLESKSITALVALVDQQQTIDVTQSYRDAAFRTFDLFEKWRHKENEHYTINPYCDWCALRGECPAWRAEADYVLARANEIGTPERLQAAKIDHLKNSPGDLERFMLAYERLKTLVESEWALKDALKGHLETGYKADHFSLVKVKEKEVTEEVIDPEQYMLRVVDPIGTAKAASALKVDAEKAKSIWAEAFPKKQFPIKPQTLTTLKSGYSYIRTKK